MPYSSIQAHLHNNKGDIVGGNHAVLIEWRQTVRSAEAAYTQLAEALVECDFVSVAIDVLKCTPAQIDALIKSRDKHRQ